MGDVKFWERDDDCRMQAVKASKFIEFKFQIGDKNLDQIQHKYDDVAPNDRRTWMKVSRGWRWLSTLASTT